jgi:CDP-glucose 4,6-dehydratase
VVGLVRDRVPASPLVQSGNANRIVTVAGDLCDLALLERTIADYEIRAVFHLAAQSQVGTALKNPVDTFETNIRGTWSLLEACRRQGKVESIVVASSDKAYGSSAEMPYREDLPLAGRFPYDVSKSCADLIALSYYHTFQLPVLITRCANLFGGGDLNFNRIIPGTIRWALEGARPIIRSDGRFVRDYLYVEDAVSAYLSLSEAMGERGVSGEAFNISANNTLSVLEVTERLLALMGKSELQPIILNEAKAEIPHQSLSSEKLTSRLGWQPRHSMDEALSKTIRWYEAHLAGSMAQDTRIEPAG